MENKYGKVLASWSFPEINTAKRSRAWYIVVTTLFVGLSIYALATDNFLFFFILILFVLIFFISYRNASEVHFQITEDGIAIGKKFYHYDQIQDFWLVYKPPEIKHLYFTLKKLFLPQISVPLQNQNPVEIRKALLKYIDENEENEDMPMSDQFTQLFKL